MLLRVCAVHDSCVVVIPMQEMTQGLKRLYLSLGVLPEQLEKHVSGRRLDFGAIATNLHFSVVIEGIAQVPRTVEW